MPQRLMTTSIQCFDWIFLMCVTNVTTKITLQVSSVEDVNTNGNTSACVAIYTRCLLMNGAPFERLSPYRVW